MQETKPKDIGGYKTWLKSRHQVEISLRTHTYYDAVASKVAADFKVAPFWQALTSGLERINQQYYLDTNYYLFLGSSPPEVCTKPFDSFLLKTFRENVATNKNWPEPPDRGWLLPDNWFTRINDIVRTYFVVKYLDGVNFVTEKLKALGNETHCPCSVDYEAKEEGYYAAHFYISFTCNIPREDWDTRKETISVELQITTQLQEVIRRLLHKFYERRRAEQPATDVKWQWDYKSDEFAANYLGHILHYVEGMIMDVRDKK